MTDIAGRLQPAIGRHQPLFPGAFAWRIDVLILVCLDATALSAAWLFATRDLIATSDGAATRVTLGWIFASAMVGLHAVGRNRAGLSALRTIETARICSVAVLTGAVAVALDLAWGLPLNPGHAAVGTVLALVWLLTGREVARALVGPLRRRGSGLRSVLLIGDDDQAAALHRLVMDHPGLGVEVVGLVGLSDTPSPSLAGVPRMGSLDELETALHSSGARGALIAAGAFSPDTVADIVRRSNMAGASLHLSSGVNGISHRRLALSPVAFEPLLFIKAQRGRSSQSVPKRFIDILGASVILLLAFPVLIAVVAAMRLQDDGPVLFRQQRVGRDGVPFTLLKFRSMVPDAEALLDELRLRNERLDGPLFKMGHDPRVTPFGRFLRASSLDELPQLFNVLRGDMSLVGPRPALPEEASMFSARLQRRAAVRPGITGLWQVEARDAPSFGAYERLDLYYVENRTLSLDVAIILATIPVVISRALHSVLTFVFHKTVSPQPTMAAED